MTDSTIETKPGDGGFDVGSSATDSELFEDLTDESFEDGTADRELPGETDETGDIEDQTAASVFGQLKDGDESAVDDVLADESPDDIIASATEPASQPESDATPDDDLLADEDELEALLLTGRTKDQEFLWVDSPDDDSPSAVPFNADESTGSTVGTELDSGATAASETSDGNDSDSASAGVIARLRSILDSLF